MEKLFELWMYIGCVVTTLSIAYVVAIVSRYIVDALEEKRKEKTKDKLAKKYGIK